MDERTFGPEVILPRLPHYEEAAATLMPRLVVYTLNPTAKPKGAHAVLFERVLAIEAAHAEYLHEQIVEGLVESPAILHETDEYGEAWEVPELVIGRNERACFVVTGWFVEGEGAVPRFTMARVARRNEIARICGVREAFGYPVGALAAGIEGRRPERGAPGLPCRHRGHHPSGVSRRGSA